MQIKEHHRNNYKYSSRRSTMMKQGEKCSSSIPKYPGDKGSGTKQNSGKTKHDRMTTAKKVESLQGMPTIH